MERQNDFKNVPNLFEEILKKKWDEIHEGPKVFRYKIKEINEKYLQEKYLIQLNPDRGKKRREPEAIHSLSQPFDKTKFNFMKASSNEILLTLINGNEEHVFLVNVSPIARYHILFCPSMGSRLPQTITLDSLELVVKMMFASQDRDLRIGFNSLCAFASVNHLHYHLLFEKRTLYIEQVKWNHLKGPVYFKEDYPVPAFCCNIKKLSETINAYILIKYLVDKSIAHNVLITNRKSQETGVHVIIWPRKKTEGAKQFTDFNVAICELSGWIPIYDEETYRTITAEQIEDELKKWKLDDFFELCEGIKSLY